MLRHIIAIISCFLALTANAQSGNFLDNLRKNEAGKAKVTVTQSMAIDILVNGKGGLNKIETNYKSASEHSIQANAKEGEKSQHSNSYKENGKLEANSRNSQNTYHEETAPNEKSVTVDTRKKVMRNSYKMTGYRIQVFSGGNSKVDKQKAEKAGLDMKRLFPSEPVYVHFYSPSWKCRMGNYKTTAEARSILLQVKKHYPQACIVKGTISVQY